MVKELILNINDFKCNLFETLFLIDFAYVPQVSLFDCQAPLSDKAKTS
jgi:hypothetical protein